MSVTSSPASNLLSSSSAFIDSCSTVGIFDKLEKALAFHSDEVNAIVKDLALLKGLFRSKMETVAPDYLALVTENFNDKDVDRLIEHFLDKERRKEFFRHYNEIEMLYEIISPDARSAS